MIEKISNFISVTFAMTTQYSHSIHGKNSLNIVLPGVNIPLVTNIKEMRTKSS